MTNSESQKLQQLIITAQSPLVFPDTKPASQYTDTLEYIPGAVIWGALGKASHELPAARFSRALPYWEGDAWVRVLPATAMSCKTHSGFLKEKEHSLHGVFDTLIDRICWQELQPAAFTYDPHCPTCYQLAKGFGGTYAQYQKNERIIYEKRSIQKRILTRVAVDRKRSSAAESLLYAPIVISEVNVREIMKDKGRKEKHYRPTQFLGWVWGLDDEQKGILQKGEIAIGGRTSSGLGRVTIEIHDPVAKQMGDDLDARLTQFNDCFRERWAIFKGLRPQGEPGWEPGTGNDAWTVFSVGLQSDAILVEDGWRPSMVFSAEQLQEQTGLQATLVEAQATSRFIGGWNIYWDRHKTTAVAAAAGGGYVFRTQAPHTEIVKALETLEWHGIGQRREEGYGIVRCCDEFHSKATGAAI